MRMAAASAGLQLMLARVRGFMHQSRRLIAAIGACTSVRMRGLHERATSTNCERTAGRPALSVRQRPPYDAQRGRAARHRARTLHRRSRWCPARPMRRSCARPSRMPTIRTVDAAAATDMPGVLAVVTGRDLAADGIGAIPPVAVLHRARRQADVPAPGCRCSPPSACAMSARRSRSWSPRPLHQAQDAAEAVAGRARRARRRGRRGARDGARTRRRSGRARRATSRSTGRTATPRPSMPPSPAPPMSSGCG